MGVLGAVAEFERNLLIERIQAGLARAGADGKVVGRPRALSDQQRDAVLDRLAAGESVSVIARVLAVSRPTVTRIRDRAMLVAA